MKKLLFIALLFSFTFSFSQNLEGKNINSQEKQQPASLSFVAAYPNPFTTNTNINFRSSIGQEIEFNLKNLLGKTVFTQHIRAEKGKNSFTFYRDNLLKGMYIYTLQTEHENISKRIIIK